MSTSWEGHGASEPGGGGKEGIGSSRLCSVFFPRKSDGVSLVPDGHRRRGRVHHWQWGERKMNLFLTALGISECP